MKIAILGYGKMGHMIEQIALERGHEIVLKINIENTADFNASSAAQCDVAIEFTGPATAYDNVIKAFGYGLPVVSGSTGWNDKLDGVRAYCLEHGGSFLHTSNFSVGVNIFFEINKHLARLMAAHPEYKADLKEVHHTQKLDAPSGTAVSLADQIIAGHGAYSSWVNVASSDAGVLPVVSERVDPAPGTHYVAWRSEIDDIEIIHTAHNRKGFALGAVLAAEYIHNKKGVFSMKEVLGL